MLKSLIFKYPNSTVLNIIYWNFGVAKEERRYSNHKRRMINQAFRKVQSWNIAGDYLEFGVFKGQSIVYAFEEKLKVFGKNGQMKLFAFDSFSGIRGTTDLELVGPFRDGDYSASYQEFCDFLKQKNVPQDSVITKIGNLQDTLTREFQEVFELQSQISAVVHIDVDVYEPSLIALNFVKPMLRNGSIILFDDWYAFGLDPNKGQVKALNEFLEANPKIRFNFWMDYGPCGRSFIFTSS